MKTKSVLKIWADFETKVEFDFRVKINVEM